MMCYCGVVLKARRLKQAATPERVPCIAETTKDRTFFLRHRPGVAKLVDAEGLNPFLNCGFDSRRPDHLNLPYMICATAALRTDQTLSFAGDDGLELHYFFGLWWEPE